MFAPRLKDYDISVLVSLGDKELNEIKRDQIKLLILEKLLQSNCSMFFLVNSFLRTNNILKEAYAEAIIIKMKEVDYLLDEVVIDDILRYVSLNSLMHYGAESKNELFSKKCVEEFWDRASKLEDKDELNNKRGNGRIRLKNIFNRKER